MTGRAGGRFRWRIGAGSREVGNWAVSLAATAASTYALDATATAAGIYLVAAGLLAGLNHQWVLTFLVASYILWGLGLRASVRANWTLLEKTGTSTNVLSKAAYDMTRRRSSGGHASRRAAAVGYIGAEAAKELPYYTVAFGAAVTTDSISSNEALIFLGGTNLGAALYEYGLARVTAALLRRSRRRSPTADRQPNGTQPPTTRTGPAGSPRHRAGQDHPATGPLGQIHPRVDKEVMSVSNRSPPTDGNGACPRANHRFHTRAEVRLKIATWIVDYYNTRRRHSACDGMSPIEYERLTAQASGGQAPAPRLRRFAGACWAFSGCGAVRGIARCG